MWKLAKVKSDNHQFYLVCQARVVNRLTAFQGELYLIFSHAKAEINICMRLLCQFPQIWESLELQK